MIFIRCPFCGSSYVVTEPIKLFDKLLYYKCLYCGLHFNTLTR